LSFQKIRVLRGGRGSDGAGSNGGGRKSDGAGSNGGGRKSDGAGSKGGGAPLTLAAQ
jgi:hypothetical protein